MQFDHLIRGHPVHVSICRARKKNFFENHFTRPIVSHSLRLGSKIIFQSRGVELKMTRW